MAENDKLQQLYDEMNLPESQEMMEIDENGIIPVSASMIKMENESIAAMAVARPRHLQRVFIELREEIEAAPSVAEDYIYRIPYKTGRGSTTWIEGLSIRALELIARNMGYIMSSSRIIQQTEDECTVEGVVIDMQKGVKYSVQRHVSRKAKVRGQWTLLTEDRWQMKILAESSKARRSAMEAIVPATLKRLVWEASVELSGKQMKSNLQQMKQAFSDLGIDIKRIENWLGKTLSNCNPGELGELRAIYRAIRDNETTPEDAFPLPEDDVKAAPPTGRHSTSNVARPEPLPDHGQKPKPEPDPEPEPEEPEPDTEKEPDKSPESDEQESAVSGTSELDFDDDRLSIVKMRAVLEDYPGVSYDDFRQILKDAGVKVDNFARSIKANVDAGKIVELDEQYYLPDDAPDKKSSAPKQDELPMAEEKGTTTVADGETRRVVHKLVTDEPGKATAHYRQKLRDEGIAMPLADLTNLMRTMAKRGYLERAEDDGLELWSIPGASKIEEEDGWYNSQEIADVRKKVIALVDYWGGLKFQEFDTYNVRHPELQKILDAMMDHDDLDMQGDTYTLVK